MRVQVWSAMLAVVLLAPLSSYGAEAKEATEKKGEAMKMSARASRTGAFGDSYEPLDL